MVSDGPLSGLNALHKKKLMPFLNLPICEVIKECALKNISLALKNMKFKVAVLLGGRGWHLLAPLTLVEGLPVDLVRCLGIVWNG